MRKDVPDHRSNNGDRILVNKFIYDFAEPERFDVIVFKNPNNGKQNYIKRLIGLPGDRLLIENGDIYNFEADENGIEQKTIVRKPLDKVQVMLQLVDDTNFRSKKMDEVNWPDRWMEWSAPNTHWRNNKSDGKRYFSNDGQKGELSWLRYRHLVPRSEFDELAYQNSRVGQKQTEWEKIELGKLPTRIFNDKTKSYSAGSLIRDQYEYNDRLYEFEDRRMQSIPGVQAQNLTQGSHWVGDLAFEAELQIVSESGEVAFDLVEGGVHFQCIVDIETGTARIETIGDQGNVRFEGLDGESPTAQTELKGPGNYVVKYAQMDNMIYLWVDGQNIKFNSSAYVLKNGKRPIPKYTRNDPGDAEPLGIGAANVAVRINRLKVYRDIYYVAPIASLGDSFDTRNETGFPNLMLVRAYEFPERWSGDRKIFDRPISNEPMFELGPGQYFPMGDNSPASHDARVWDGPKYVPEEMLIGRAMFIYWPHSLNSPVTYFPNFQRMGFIR
ncbi:MAG: signal peptidase I, partial [Planctomycetota bacterium]